MANQGYQWITMDQIPLDVDIVSGSIVGGTEYNDVSVIVTHTGGGMNNHSGTVSRDRFPSTIGGVASNIPAPGNNQIKNTRLGIVRAVFSRPVTNALIAFGSVGQPTTFIPVEVLTPFTPIWGEATTYDDAVAGTTPTQYRKFTGNEGNNIIQLNGTLSEVSFNYTLGEVYSTFSFGFLDQNDPSINPCNFIFDRHAYRSESGCRRFKRLRHLGYL